MLTDIYTYTNTSFSTYHTYVGMVILLARYGADLSQDCGRQWWTQAPEPGVGMPLSGLVASEAPQGAATVELVSKPNVDVTVPLQFFVKVCCVCCVCFMCMHAYAGGHRRVVYKI